MQCLQGSCTGSYTNAQLTYSHSAFQDCQCIHVVLELVPCNNEGHDLLEIQHLFSYLFLHFYLFFTWGPAHKQRDNNQSSLNGACCVQALAKRGSRDGISSPSRLSSSRGAAFQRGQDRAHRMKTASPSRQERSPERQKQAGQRGRERQRDRHSHSPERQPADRGSHQGSKRGAQLSSPRGRNLRGCRGAAVAASPRQSRSARRRRNSRKQSPALASPAEQAPQQPCLSRTPARHGAASGQASLSLILSWLLLAGLALLDARQHWHTRVH